MLNETCDPDPGAWYRARYGEEPDYAKLLDALAKSPEERQQMLAAFFEPTEQEREDGLKLPTTAHCAIARLVASGHIRVIITTNFDRLIERAIEEGGITPVVLNTPDAMEGALPLVHQRCCIVKLHGDYLDTRIKNSPAELAAYDPRVDAILDRVLDEFGLLVCGWSGQWDIALRAAIERCKSRRFSTYWACRGQPSAELSRLIELRAGTLLCIGDADSLFQELSERVAALAELEQPHPLSAAVAAATTKRLLAEERHLIRLHDFVQQEIERTFTSLQLTFAEVVKRGNQKQQFSNAVQEFSSKTALLRTIGNLGAYWGKHIHERTFSEIVPRLAIDPHEAQGGIHVTDSIRVIPSIMVLYSMGISALANHNFSMLAAILSKQSRTRRGQRQHYLTVVDWPGVQEWFKLLEGYDRKFFPASEWLFQQCREDLRPLVPVDADYERLFDVFEVLRSLVYIDLEHGGNYSSDQNEVWGPPGRFVWKVASRGRYEGNHLGELKGDESVAAGLTTAGLFGGDKAIFAAVIDKFAPMVQKMSTHCW
jgi:hypothetical protein